MNFSWPLNRKNVAKAVGIDPLFIMVALCAFMRTSHSAPASPPPEDYYHNEHGREFFGREECEDAKNPDACREGFDEGAESYTEGK